MTTPGTPSDPAVAVGPSATGANPYYVSTPSACCDDGPWGHTPQEHHDASPCYDEGCWFAHPLGGPYPHPCDAAQDDRPGGAS